MRSSNPVFSREGSFSRDTGYAGFGTQSGAGRYDQPLSAEHLEELYRAPAAGPSATGRMTIDDVVANTALTLLMVVAAGAVAWFALPTASFQIAGAAALAAFVVGLVISFRRSVNPALVLLYAGLEGFFLGALTKVFNTIWPGIAIQAVLGTAAVFAGMLIAYRTGRIKVTARYTRVGLAIALGFVLLMLVNLVASLFGASLGLNSGPLGIVVGLVGVGLGAFFLSLDFAAVEQAIRGGAPRRESWRAAFGLTLSLVWIYLELLRLIAILRGDD
ncbi:Bax inhibitor-1/YccA family protein [Kitasatospora kifunensis]|uniref:Putative YccA/Bax inhibitor family protein n=1 Tax=Kitasatospora kifunensis TaxID=58351 RepID=A0A7W7VVV1_KITKI|nr:Bax inhibitor-1/YccA family protein [Kitasatospora kifunensis]MBB4923880.1 putative YccA/Bax inhibitor family protein [Kitasatospora kifunensis]